MLPQLSILLNVLSRATTHIPQPSQASMLGMVPTVTGVRACLPSAAEHGYRISTSGRALVDPDSLAVEGQRSRTRNRVTGLELTITCPYLHHGVVAGIRNPQVRSVKCHGRWLRKGMGPARQS